MSSFNPTKEGLKERQPSKDAPIYTDAINRDTTQEQQSTFDALNTLQVSTDKKNRLYSTFAGIAQPCYPPDTSLTISQSELLLAMKQFVTVNCTKLPAKKRDELTAISVLAQDEYKVSLCLNNSIFVSYENGIPMTGTWVLPNILGIRDLVNCLVKNLAT